MRDRVRIKREAEAPKTTSDIRTFVSFHLPAPAQLLEEETCDVGTVLALLSLPLFLNCLENLPAVCGD